MVADAVPAKLHGIEERGDFGGAQEVFGALVGEEALSQGRVLLNGENVSDLPLWRRARLGLGYIPQTPSVLWDLSVEDNFRTFFRVARDAKASDDEVDAACAVVGLAEQKRVRAGSLSGGERRRLELGRALMTKPTVLVCDEPFAGVDPKGAAHLGELLAKLADSGVAVLLADHHVDEALRVCTRALLLLDGAVALLASPQDFRSDPLVQGRYLGTWEGSR